MERAVALSPNDSIMLYNGACFYAMMGEKALSVEHLQKSIANGYEDYEYIKRDSDLDSIHNEPGYVELMKGK